MDNFGFHAPTQVIFGKGTEAQVGALCKEYGAHKVLVHFGGSSAKKSGLLDRVCASLTAAGLEYVLLGGVVPNPLLSKVYEGIELGKKEGREIIIGGRHGGKDLLPNQPHLAEGYWVEPTLIRVDSNSLRICQEEIFGPVATVIPFDTEDEAIAMANDTEFGLGAGVWTTNLNRAHRMIRKLESGNVWVNTYRTVGPELPFGGQKSSGYGVDSIMEFTREKTCYIDIG